MQLSERLAIVLVLVAFSFAPQSASAAAPAIARIVPAPSDDPDSGGTSNFWVVRGYDKDCTIERISFGTSGCSLVLTFEHGASWFSCGKDAPRSQTWNWTSGQFVGLAITTTGTTRPVKIPPHKEARKTWIGPVDSEGMEHAGYPINGDVMADWYPRNLLRSNLARSSKGGPFPVVTQSVIYKTMHGKNRAFVGGRITFAPGAELTLYRWVEPDKAAESVLAGQLLAGVRLIADANPPVEERARVCQRPNQN